MHIPEGQGQIALLAALLEQNKRHNEDVKAKGGDAAFLVDWMSKHPDPTKVGDFVENLLCVPSGQVANLLKAGEQLPPGFKEWRQLCYDTYKSSLPIAEWKQLAKHPELIPSAAELRKATGDKLAELKMRVWAADLIITTWTLCGIYNIDTDTKDLYPKGKGIVWELYDSDKSVRALKSRLDEAKKITGEVPVHGQEIYRAHDAKKALLEKMRGEIQAAAEDRAGSEGYAGGYGGAQVTQKRATPGLLSVRLSE